MHTCMDFYLEIPLRRRRSICTHIHRIMEGKVCVCLFIVFFFSSSNAATTLGSYEWKWVCGERVQSRVVLHKQLANGVVWVLHLRVTDVYVDLRQFKMFFSSTASSSSIMDDSYRVMTQKKGSEISLSKANCTLHVPVTTITIHRMCSILCKTGRPHTSIDKRQSPVTSKVIVMSIFLSLPFSPLTDHHPWLRRRAHPCSNLIGPNIDCREGYLLKIVVPRTIWCLFHEQF